MWRLLGFNLPYSALNSIFDQKWPLISLTRSFLLNTHFMENFWNFWDLKNYFFFLFESHSKKIKKKNYPTKICSLFAGLRIWSSRRSAASRRVHHVLPKMKNSKFREKPLNIDGLITFSYLPLWCLVAIFHEKFIVDNLFSNKVQ